MKKILFLLLLLPIVFFAQNKPDWDYDLNRPIGAFFPNYFPLTSKYMAAQNTYYEYNWVSNNMQNLIHNYFKLNRISKDIEGSNYIINTYKTPAGSVIDILKIKYNVFEVYGLQVVSSVEITGTKLQVVKLFVYLYNNEIQSNNLKNGFIKTMAQDRAVYNVINGNSSIIISNSVYKNNTEFKTHFEKLKEDFKANTMLIKLEEEQKRIAEEQYYKKTKIQFTKDSIARKEEVKKSHEDFKKEQNIKPKVSIYVYYFKKSRKELSFKTQPSESLEKEIIDKMKDYKNGSYTAYVTTTEKLDSKSYEIKINVTDAKF